MKSSDQYQSINADVDFTKLAESAPLALAECCRRLEQQLPLNNEKLFTPFGLLDGHPWSPTARENRTTYYSSLYGVAKNERPRKILEIGSAFGMSCATFLSASPGVELFVSIDLGIYGSQYPEKIDNVAFAQERVHSWCKAVGVDQECVRFYRANSQPRTKGDNENLGTDVPHWSLIPEVVRLLQEHQFDIVFVDGKHTEDGLLNDMQTFWSFLKPGGLLICDDLHEPVEYAGTFSWVGDTWRSYYSFLQARRSEISESFLWNFPEVPPFGKMGKRPFGLIRKNPVRYPLTQNPQFSMFDSDGARTINFARQDHLASLGLDLSEKRVLEVGAGVGWHTGFFEKLGCSVITTDARAENVSETLQRFPYRKGRVHTADLDVPASHESFGAFDIIYCYGTLYHLNNPSLCLSDLAAICRGQLLMETCVNQHDNAAVNLVAEDRNNPNQSFAGEGCRPGRDWVMAELRKYFPYVYISNTQPNFYDFQLDWPVSLPAGVQNSRAIFVASRTPLDLPTLATALPMKQERLRRVIGPSTLREPTTALVTKTAEVFPATTAVSKPAVAANISGEKASIIPALNLISRQRLGRMLNRPSMVTEDELMRATAILGVLFVAKNPGEFIDRERNYLPETLLPLLTLHLVAAINSGNEPLAEALEHVFSLLSRQPKTTATKVNAQETTQASKATQEQTANDEFSTLRQQFGKALARAQPISEEELNAAITVLNQILDSDFLSPEFQPQFDFLPPALRPLIAYHLQAADQNGDKTLKDSLQKLYSRLFLEADIIPAGKISTLVSR